MLHLTIATTKMTNKKKHKHKSKMHDSTICHKYTHQELGSRSRNMYTGSRARARSFFVSAAVAQIKLDGFTFS
jgi:hypothetical protein